MALVSSGRTSLFPPRKPSRSGVLQPLSPLRTVLDSFPSHGSSILKVILGGRPACFVSLCRQCPKLSSGQRRKQFAGLIVSAAPEISGIFRRVRVGFCFYLHMSFDSYGTDAYNLIYLFQAVCRSHADGKPVFPPCSCPVLLKQPFLMWFNSNGHCAKSQKQESEVSND